MGLKILFGAELNGKGVVNSYFTYYLHADWKMYDLLLFIYIFSLKFF